jgi:hypothetical protein
VDGAPHVYQVLGPLPKAQLPLTAEIHSDLRYQISVHRTVRSEFQPKPESSYFPQWDSLANFSF